MGEEGSLKIGKGGKNNGHQEGGEEGEVVHVQVLQLQGDDPDRSRPLGIRFLLLGMPGQMGQERGPTTGGGGGEIMGKWNPGASCDCGVRTEIISLEDKSSVRYCGWCGKKLTKKDQDIPYEQTVAYADQSEYGSDPFG